MRTYLSCLAILVAISIVAPLRASGQSSGSGKPAPDMKGPAPRLANGKPSMAGIWSTTRRADVTNKSIPGYIAELPYTAWGKKEWDNYNPTENGDYAGSCLPFGFSRSLYGPHPTQIVQDSDYVVFLFEREHDRWCWAERIELLHARGPTKRLQRRRRKEERCSLGLTNTLTRHINWTDALTMLIS